MSRMLKALCATLLALWLQSLAVSSDPVFLTSFTNQIELTDQDNSTNSTNSYTLYWTYNTTYIQIEVQFSYASWGLFGIQDPDSSTSDAALFWVNSEGTGYFAGVVLNSDNSYTVNPDQNWLPMNAVMNSDTQIFHFGRNIKVKCNSSNSSNVDFQPGNMTVVYSIGDYVDIYNMAVVVSSVSNESVTILDSANGPFACPLAASVSKFDSIPTGNYDNEIDLMDGGMARIYWNYNSSHFTGELHVRTSGWVAFGFSPSGDMGGSNVMVFWLDQNNSPNFSERYLYGDSSNPYGAPRGANRTAIQSWTLLYYGQYNGYTIVKFQRPIVLCGPNQFTIPTGTPFGIFAFGTTPSAGKDIGYHGANNRGSKQAAFVSTENPVQSAPADMETYDFSLSNIILPYAKTTYYCYPFQVPTSFAVKRHIYAFEVVLPEINLKNIHHILLYECPRDIYNGTPPLLPDTCGVTVSSCPIVSLAWAVGGNTLQIFPSDTGYPIGGDSDYNFFLIQLHYNNPEKKLGYVSKLSIRYHMTKTLRPNELGVLTLGTSTDKYSIAIPPGIPDFTLNTYCSNNCISRKLAQLGQNITAVSSLLHTHLTGTSVSTKILRNGQMVGYLSKNLYYSFNYQYSLAINPRINITPNDALLTTCTYNTQSRTGFTFGGEETTDEMCFNFVMYYPRNKILRTCLSLPTFGSYVTLFRNLTSTGEMNVTSSSLSSTSKALTAAYSTVRVTDNLRSIYKTFFATTQTIEMCDTSYNPGPLNPLTYTNNYTEFNPCQSSVSVSNSSNSTGPNSNPPSQTQTVFQKITSFFENLWTKFKNFFNF